jgi:symplekin
MTIPFSDKVTIGFITLRGLVLQRPSLRTEALNSLLELTTHPGKSMLVQQSR